MPSSIHNKPKTGVVNEKASKYPYKYQQDVQDRNTFRMQMKAELKAMAKESFLEEMERMKLGPQSLGRGGVTTFPAMHFPQPRRGQHANSTMQLEWSSTLAKDQHASDLTMMYTSRTEPASAGTRQKSNSPSRHQLNNTSSGESSSQNQMFVLSSAPIQSFEKLIHDQTHNGSLDLDTNSLLDQANRYAELQSLFQMPLMSQELLYGSGLDQESEILLREEQERARQQAKETRLKLENSIAQHKDRLEYSRHHDRVHHSGLLAKSAVVNQPLQLPISKINQSPRFNSRRFVNHQHGDDHYHPRDGSGSPDLAQHGIHSQQSSPHSPHAPSHHHNNNSPYHHSHNYHHNRSTNSLLTTESAFLEPHQVRAPPSTANKQHEDDDGSVGAGGGGEPGGLTGLTLPSSPGNENETSAENTVAGATTVNGEGKQKVKTSVISVNSFQKKTNRMGTELAQLVRDSVHQELVADGRAQHYTRRFQQKVIRDKEEPLVDRIERAVGDKIAALQKELEALKQKKLRRFTKNSKRIGTGKVGSAGGSGGKLTSAGSMDGLDLDDAASYFNPYDLDDDELPNWLKQSGEILHVLERTQLQAQQQLKKGSSESPTRPGQANNSHIDVRALNNEINRSIEMTLRRMLLGQFQQNSSLLFDPSQPSTTTMNQTNTGAVTASTKEMMSTRGDSKLEGSMTSSTKGGSRVHGRIESGKVDNSAYDSIGFDSISSAKTKAASATSNGVQPARPSIPGSLRSAATAPAATPSAPVVEPYVEEAPKKPKSKAERMLGMATDPTSGMPVNLDTSKQQQGGLFGSIGSLFGSSAASSKPGSGALIGGSTASGRPSMMMSMMSSRESTNGNSSHAPMSVRAPPPSGGMGRNTLQPIIDEGNEDAVSGKLSVASNTHGGSPQRPSSNTRDKDGKVRSGKHKPGATDKGDTGSDAGKPSRSDSVASNTTAGLSISNVAASVANAVNGTEGGGNTTPQAAATSAGNSRNVSRNMPAMSPALLAEMNAEEAIYRTLMQNLLSLADVKVNIKRELKDWERLFAQRNGREPTADDKAMINDRYLAYKLASSQVQDAKDLVKASEDKMKEIRERAAAEQL